MKIIKIIELSTMKGGRNLSLKLEELKQKLKQSIKDTSTNIEETLKISKEIDEEIIKEYQETR